ncbi:hypothetical protein CRM22_009533 [Opisthorchis felineus]|uniref:BHLH domain-containing protein n=1 Tax=Opisthorchis felineus TaxID=147828 RepID=A0A4S2LDI9_OPIFE|nr:hypothetical protein CRM22_009533 [Opisthorchis felineus]
MSYSCHSGDGLLLLLQAARKLESEDTIQRPCYSDGWDHRPNTRANADHKYVVQHNYGYNASKRQIAGPRCTHNELEKSRRAHLRACMETLKEHLNFDNDMPRITMLAVLKKATTTIQYLRQRKQCLETCEDSEKQRYAQLVKRRIALRKKLEEKKSRFLKLQSWRERNRNCSECSITTTSSDDSELDLQLRSTHTASHGPSSPNRHPFDPFSRGENASLGVGCVLSNNKHVSPLGSSTRFPSGIDHFDASSSDSGFDEVTIGSSGKTSPDGSLIPYCVSETPSMIPTYFHKPCSAS